MMSIQETAATTPLPASPDGAWEDMLAAFRALGGTAENIRLGHSPFGRGLFPIDPSRPVLLKLPDNLLFPVENVEFVGDRIRITDAAETGKPEREFFDAYESGFSWGGGGQSESAAFIAALDALPAEVRERLVADFGMGKFLQGDAFERTTKRFLVSRYITWKGKDVLMPLIELANYAANGLAYSGDAGGSLQVRGTPQDEVLVSYGRHDTFAMFYTFGFLAPQQHANSLPMRARLDELQVVIEWNIAAQARRGELLIPQLRRDGSNVSLSYLAIGNVKFPRLSRGCFQTLMRECGAKNPDEAFDFILHYNRKKFLNLLAALEPHEGPMIGTLRAMARFQLEAMTNCIGTRDL